MVNSAIAVGASLLLAFLVASRYGALPAVAVEAVALAAGLGTIYLRGYLVPYTPTLTARYAPEWFLDLFGKTEVGKDEVVTGERDGEDPLRVERTLVDAAVLGECRDGDLCLTDAFQSELRARVERVRAGGDRDDAVLTALGDGADIVRADDAVRLHVDDRPVSEWESGAAYIGDAAVAPLLADRIASWGERPPMERVQLLQSVRLFVEACPACDGSVSFAAERVESCCSSRDVAAITCDECGAHVLETEPGAATLTL